MTFMSTLLALMQSQHDFLHWRRCMDPRWVYQSHPPHLSPSNAISIPTPASKAVGLLFGSALIININTSPTFTTVSLLHSPLLCLPGPSAIAALSVSSDDSPVVIVPPIPAMEVVLALILVCVPSAPGPPVLLVLVEDGTAVWEAVELVAEAEVVVVVVAK